MQISLWDSVIVSFSYITRSGIPGLCHNSIFKFLSKCHSVVHSDYTMDNNRAGVCHFLHILANIFYPSGYRMVSHCGFSFGLYFLND
jgi:hypothetical protein